MAGKEIDTNTASRTRYQIVFDRLPNVLFNAVRCTIPGVSLGVATIPTPFKNMGFAGTTIDHDQFSMQFILNESHSNHGEILHWMEGIGFPESFDQYKEVKDSEAGIESDFSVTVFSNAGNPVARYRFTHAFPTQLSAIDYDSQDTSEEPIVVSASFEYMLFKHEALT